MIIGQWRRCCAARRGETRASIQGIGGKARNNQSEGNLPGDATLPWLRSNPLRPSVPDPSRLARDMPRAAWRFVSVAHGRVGESTTPCPGQCHAFAFSPLHVALYHTFVVVHPFSSFHRLFVHPTTFDSALLVQSFLLVPFHPLSLSIYLYPSFSPSLPFLPSPLYPSLSLCLCLSHRHSRFPALSKINTSQRGLKTCVNMVLHCLYVHITLSARLLPPTGKPAGHFTTPYRRAR